MKKPSKLCKVFEKFFYLAQVLIYGKSMPRIISVDKLGQRSHLHTHCCSHGSVGHGLNLNLAASLKGVLPLVLQGMFSYKLKSCSEQQDDMYEIVMLTQLVNYNHNFSNSTWNEKNITKANRPFQSVCKHLGLHTFRYYLTRFSTKTSFNYMLAARLFIHALEAIRESHNLIVPQTTINRQH